jgi:hypothetical protein
VTTGCAGRPLTVKGGTREILSLSREAAGAPSVAGAADYAVARNRPVPS